MGFLSKFIFHMYVKALAQICYTAGLIEKYELKMKDTTKDTHTHIHVY